MNEEQPRESDTPAAPAAADRPAPTVEPDGDPSWRFTLYAAWVAQIISIIGFSFVMPFFPFYIRELGITDPRLVPIWSGLVMTAGGISMTVAGPLWGIVADRYGRKLMVQRAMFGGAVIMGLMGLVSNVYHLLVLRLLQGAVTGTVPASIALVSSVTPRNRMGYSLGLMQMAVFAGSSLGPWLGGSVADRFGYRMPFAVTAGLLVCAGLLVLFGTRERFQRPAAHEVQAAPSIRGLLRLPGVATLLAVYFALNLSATIVAPIFPLFVERLLHTDVGAASATGMILAISGIAAAAAAVVIGRASDRLGPRRILAAATAAAGLMCFPQAVARTVGQLLAVRVVFGLAAGGMGPTLNSLVAGLVPRHRLGSIYGMTAAASSLGAAMGPLLGGWLAASMGLRAPFVLMGAMLLLLSVMVQWRVAPPPPGDAEPNDAQ
jgi:DHA1 family multidrug resistance protein-like MFS transporter